MKKVTKKVTKIEPFFFSMVVEHVLDGWIEEEWATDGQEFLEIKLRLMAKYPEPIYLIHVKACDKVVKS